MLLLEVGDITQATRRELGSQDVLEIEVYACYVSLAALGLALRIFGQGRYDRSQQ